MAIAQLVLADGTVFLGQSLTDSFDAKAGEVVFSTAMTGYTEILTDPSYYGQIVVLAHPEIGNYGINRQDFQSEGIKIKALVVRNLSMSASSHRAEMTLSDWLQREEIPVIYDIDTRALILHLRDYGAILGAVSTCRRHSAYDLLSIIDKVAPMDGQRLSSYVAARAPLTLLRNERAKFHVVVMDFGIKRAIIDCLMAIGAKVTLIPPDSSSEEVFAKSPDGFFLSNGPGDPKTEIAAVATTKSLLGKVPIFGVCLGHQILAQALGYKTYKLKFGHRGSNHPVMTESHKIVTTAQNHGFAVSINESSTLFVSHNISDQTNEGIEAPELSAFSVQFHPEGSPGPRDALAYFQKFADLMVAWKKTRTFDRYGCETGLM